MSMERGIHRGMIRQSEDCAGNKKGKVKKDK